MSPFSRAAAVAATLVLLSILSSACGPGAGPGTNTPPSHSERNER
jgi:hypothetical protein